MKIIFIILSLWISLLEAQTDGTCNDYPIIKDGDVHTYPDESGLTVQCALLYTLEGPEKVYCVNGQWSELPNCIPPCKLDQRLFYSPQNLYINHGKEMTVWCYMNGWIDVKCNNSKAFYKGCGYYDW